VSAFASEVVSAAVLAAMLTVSLASSAVAQTVEASGGAQDQHDDRDHAFVLELGAAGDWSRAEGFHPGGTVAFEVTPIEHWLELEVGVTAIHTETGTEMPVDVLFKKPWRFSPAFEFMVGVGPEIVHETGADRGTFWGLSSVLDFMFWPTNRVGWYVEPAYEVTFPRGGTHHGVGIAVGVLIGR
jgi:hypothetical protein